MNPAPETNRAIHLLERWRFILEGVWDTSGTRRERYLRRREGDEQNET